jgi:hypothetical protein
MPRRDLSLAEQGVRAFRRMLREKFGGNWLNVEARCRIAHSTLAEISPLAIECCSDPAAGSSWQPW